MHFMWKFHRQFEDSRMLTLYIAGEDYRCSAGDGTVTLFLLLTHLSCIQLISKPPPYWFRECSTTGPSLRGHCRVDTHFIDSVVFVLCPHCDHLCTQAGVTVGSHKELESFFGVFWCRPVYCVPALFLLWPLQGWDTCLLSRGLKKTRIRWFCAGCILV